MPIEQDVEYYCDSQNTDYFGCADPNCIYWEDRIGDFLHHATQRSIAMCNPKEYSFAYGGGWEKRFEPTKE